jgi:hypothetical protein
MPLLNLNEQKAFKQHVVKQISKTMSREDKQKIKHASDRYKVAEGSVEDLRAFKAVLQDVYGDEASQAAYVESIQCALLVTTEALINRVESACLKDGVTIKPEAFKILVVRCIDSKPTQATIKQLQHDLDVQLKNGVKSYNEDEKSTTPILEYCLYRVKNLIGLVVGLVTCLALGCKPYREGLREMFFTPPETKESRAFRSHAAQLHHDVVEHVEAYVMTGP